MSWPAEPAPTECREQMRDAHTRAAPSSGKDRLTEKGRRVDAPQDFETGTCLDALITAVSVDPELCRPRSRRNAESSSRWAGELGEFVPRFLMMFPFAGGVCGSGAAPFQLAGSR